MAITPVDLQVTNITATSARLRWVNALQALISSLFGAGEPGAIYIPIPVVLGAQSLFQDAAGTVPVTADGDPVGKMIDQSGNGNHALQDNSSKRFIYKAGDALLQDQVDDSITISGLSLNPTLGTKTWTLCVGYSDFGNENVILLSQLGGTRPWIGIGQSGSNSENLQSPGVTQTSVWFDGVIEYPATRGDMWALMSVSGVIVIEFTFEVSSILSWDNPTIGRYANSSFYGPKTSEFYLLREGALTESQRKELEAYAAELAGVNL